MGNSIGGRKRSAKVMRIDGSTVKVKPPAVVGDVLRDHAGYVLLDSDHVKQLGLRATPLDPSLHLTPGKLYFLVNLPRLPAAGTGRPRGPARRVRSAINVSAKDRLESLMLTRRSVSDLSFSRATPGEAEGVAGDAVRLRVRLPRAQVARLLEESGNPAEAAEKIVKLFRAGGGGGAWEVPGTDAGDDPPAPGGAVSVAVTEKREKRTRFSPVEDQIIS